MEEHEATERELEEEVTEEEILKHSSCNGLLPEAQKTMKERNKRGMPSDSRLQMLMIRSAQDSIDNQAEGTSKLYGNLKDPGSGKGYAREFADWCKARGGTVLNGVLLPEEKEVYGAFIPSEAVAYEFMSEYWLLRKHYRAKTRDYTIDKPHSKSAIDNVIKALIAMYRYQAKAWIGGKEDFKQLVGNPPNHDRTLNALRAAYMRKTQKERLKKHLPRGLGTLAMEGYTEEQNLQLCEFGMTNDSRRKHDFSKMTQLGIRSVHTGHVTAENLVLRWDDRGKTFWSQFCLREAEGRMAKEGLKLTTLVLDKRKNNQFGNYESVSSLRHLDNPLKCTDFALAMELFCQTELEGMPFTMEDFKPIPRMQDGFHDGTYYHRWYDRYVFVGQTKSRKGQASTPNPYAPATYQSTLNYFTRVYGQIEPPIRSYHKLHLQRGTVARRAEAEDVPTNQIGNQGGWHQDSSLFQHYLTGVPMQMIRFLAGYNPKIFPNESIPKMKRNLVQPDPNLCAKVFPFIAELEVYMKSDPDAFPPGECVTLYGFIECCKYWAKVLLQDCAVMYDEMSEHPIYTHPLFCSPEFFAFRNKLLEAMENQEQSKEEWESTNQQQQNPSMRRMLEILESMYTMAVDFGGRVSDICKKNYEEEMEQICQKLSSHNFFGSKATKAQRTQPNNKEATMNAPMAASITLAARGIVPATTTAPIVESPVVESPAPDPIVEPDPIVDPIVEPEPMAVEPMAVEPQPMAVEPQRMQGAPQHMQPHQHHQTQIMQTRPPCLVRDILQAFAIGTSHLPAMVKPNDPPQLTQPAHIQHNITSPSTGVDLQNPATWPASTPPWAKSKWLYPAPTSVEMVVREYLHGYPNPPALIHLEDKYGPSVARKGESWRAGNNSKEGNRKRKAWCERMELYAFIRKSPEDAETRLEQYIRHHFASHFTHGAKISPKSPGAHLLRQAWMLMKRTSEGAQNRTNLAKKRAATRKANKESRLAKKTREVVSPATDTTATDLLEAADSLRGTTDCSGTTEVVSPAIGGGDSEVVSPDFGGGTTEVVSPSPAIGGGDSIGGGTTEVVSPVTVGDSVCGGDSVDVGGVATDSDGIDALLDLYRGHAS